ncbi:putative ABC transport system permease protein [Faunimonas pinastri]|uniref:Putative ABC transport system permease protein n=1 Tax=Faunimonas pinastri TaxID=1855383 RepID=A0A1H9MEA9_9HYPH|nr:ABC transporter permease [Faunimonas pinastri]SER22036.1 putative ABC transport system permease protein [Faunimonas pinastri]
MNGAASAQSRSLPISLRFALRELRGGLAGFYVFLACIALGVASIAGVNSVSHALTEGISTQGRTILGGDLSISLIHRDLGPEQKAFFARQGTLDTVATMRAMAVRPDGADQTLVELKSVDAAYPRQGELALEGGGDGQALLRETDGAFGALAAPELLDRLNLKVGDDLKLGALTLKLRGVIASEPDRLSEGIGFGPHLMISLDALQRTELLQPGALVTWMNRLSFAGPADPARAKQLAADADKQFPNAGWRMRTSDNASPSLSGNIDRFAQFLTLVGLTALIVGGVGVANAVSSFVDLKRPAIATLKSLGASAGTIFRIYFLQILILALFGIAIGLVVGAILPFVAKWALSDLLPVADVGLYPAELGLAFVYGLLVTVAFSLWPLGRARQMPATSLFADRALGSNVRPPWIYRIFQLVALLLLAGLAIALSSQQRLAVMYIAAVVVAFVVLRLVAVLITFLARHAGRIRGTTLRLAIRNIQRPGALTSSVVLSLGLGLTLLVSLALIDTNLRGQLTGAIADKAPDFFFIDIQNADRDRFVDLLKREAPAASVDTVPMLRGRITAVKGVPATEVKAGEGGSWALQGDRGVTFADTLPRNSRLVQGSWWAAGYDGEPLVSFEEGVAKALNLGIGDHVTVNVLGRNVTARIANIRAVDWDSLSINFVMVFSPNTFAGAPVTDLATLSLPKGGDPGLDRHVASVVTKTFPAVTSVRVKDAIDSVNDLIGKLALAVRVAASLALVVSMLVLGGALAAGHRQRRQDAVILKALGATRTRLLTAFSLEYGILGLATAVFAVAAGSVAAWYVGERVMHIPFHFRPEIAVAAALIALAVTLGLGLAGTWRILSVKAGPFLRNL